MGQGNCAIRLIQLLSSRRLLWPDEACVSPAKWTSTCPPAAVIDDRSAHGEWMSALCPKLGSQPASTDDRTRCRIDFGVAISDPSESLPVPYLHCSPAAGP